MHLCLDFDIINPYNKFERAAIENSRVPYFKLCPNISELRTYTKKKLQMRCGLHPKNVISNRSNWPGFKFHYCEAAYAWCVQHLWILLFPFLIKSFLIKSSRSH